MTFHTAAAWLMLVASGLWTGVILAFQVERVNLWARMPLEQYAVDFRRSLFRVDPLQPILGIAAALAGAGFAWESAGAARMLAWTGVALLALVIAASVAYAEPINSKFRRLSEGALPVGAEAYRAAWRRFHAARTVVALAGFACLAAAVVA